MGCDTIEINLIDSLILWKIVVDDGLIYRVSQKNHRTREGGRGALQ